MNGGRVERIEPEPDDFDPEEALAKGRDGLLREGAALFDAGRYHEAHEVFEKAWLASEAGDGDFFKGLVQAAVCLLKLERGELEGARKLHGGMRRLLAAYLPEHRGLDVSALLAGMQAHLRLPEGERLASRPQMRLEEGGHEPAES